MATADQPWPTGRTSARRHIARVLILLDLLAATAAAFAAGATREALGVLGQMFSIEILPTLGMVPLVIVGLATAGCYRPAGAGLGADTFRRFSHGVAFGLLVVAAVSFALDLNLSRLYVALLGAYLLAFGLLFRWAFRRMAHDPTYDLATRVVIVGTDETACHLARTLGHAGSAAFRVLGHLALDGTVCDDFEGEPLGGLDDLPQLLPRLQPDAVLVSAESLADTEMRALYILLEPLETELIIYPSLVEVASRRLDVETAGPFPLLHLSTVRMTAGRRAVKGGLDLVVATLVTMAALPILLVAAIAVKLDSPGPVLFRQQRVGLDGQPFTLLKLRTMVTGAEDQLDELLEHNEAGDGLFKMREDPRVTRVGRVLRRWSIDELPQLVNVIAGHMSLVGPRPALPTEVDLHDPETALRRHRLKPGLTGFWQVSGRSEVAADEALRMDLYYIENWSLSFDVLILLRTVRAVLTSRGAY